MLDILNSILWLSLSKSNFIIPFSLAKSHYGKPPFEFYFIFTFDNSLNLVILVIILSSDKELSCPIQHNLSILVVHIILLSLLAPIKNMFGFTLPFVKMSKHIGVQYNFIVNYKFFSLLHPVFRPFLLFFMVYTA